jgi:hypothetical protein
VQLWLCCGVSWMLPCCCCCCCCDLLGLLLCYGRVGGVHSAAQKLLCLCCQVTYTADGVHCAALAGEMSCCSTLLPCCSTAGVR